ncbi:hypothetical protein PENTCL1PPCAC_23237 [Pristionchus entomophagus]|uniref:Uncharacterized protein n=1 Tax=Pristionchus entomophagus TaxID=358040 RepID=A0AAV5U3M9_9BILA|nr:hypothetical protein PENTCL1PPCAC_23237 [Pristionchus entomophagus]
MIYPIGDRFDENNIEGVLKLADKFGMERVMDNAEKALKAMEWDTKRLFVLANKYRLFTLQDSLIRELTKETIKDLKNSEEYENFSEKTKDLIFEKYLKLDD